MPILPILILAPFLPNIPLTIPGSDHQQIIPIPFSCQAPQRQRMTPSWREEVLAPKEPDLIHLALHQTVLKTSHGRFLVFLVPKFLVFAGVFEKDLRFWAVIVVAVKWSLAPSS